MLCALVLRRCRVVAPPAAGVQCGVDVVRIDVSVMNGLNPVAGLKRRELRQSPTTACRRRWTPCRSTRVPLNLMLVLDTSGSLAGERLTHLIDAVNGLVKSLRAEDAASLMTFSEPIRLPSRRPRIERRLLPR